GRGTREFLAEGDVPRHEQPPVALRRAGALPRPRPAERNAAPDDREDRALLDPVLRARDARGGVRRDRSQQPDEGDGEPRGGEAAHARWNERVDRAGGNAEPDGRALAVQEGRLPPRVRRAAAGLARDGERDARSSPARVEPLAQGRARARE